MWLVVSARMPVCEESVQYNALVRAVRVGAVLLSDEHWTSSRILPRRALEPGVSYISSPSNDRAHLP